MVSGTSRLGNLIQRTLGPLMAPGVEISMPVALAPPETTPVEVPIAEPQPEAAQGSVEPATTPEPVDEEGWVMPAIVFGGFNLLLIGAGVGIFLRRRRAGRDDDLGLEDLIEEPATAIEDPVQEAAA